MQKKPMKAKYPGFTLVELLIAIAIVAVLAALLFGLASRSVNSAQKAVCVSNLRGIGNALQMFINENSGRLPGPLNTGQSALFDPVQARFPDKGRSLVNFIGPYMEDVKDPAVGSYLISNYGCPSLMKKVKDNTVAKPAILYRLEDRQTKLMDNVTPRANDISYPWGYNAGVLPKRLDEISPASAGRVRMITEQNTTLGVGGWPNGGATTPAHGLESMAIYWDFSVRAVKLNQL
jgi:prepilin-type N-terminal cleavage/methylation domain-containing protein